MSAVAAGVVHDGNGVSVEVASGGTTASLLVAAGCGDLVLLARHGLCRVWSFNIESLRCVGDVQTGVENAVRFGLREVVVVMVLVAKRFVTN